MADNSTPMGGNLPEDAIGQADPLLNRNCWAIDTLIAEVTPLFGTGVATSTPNRFNANLLVEFTPEPKDAEDLAALLETMVEVDDRIELVYVDNGKSKIRVKMWDHPITMDTRDSFGIADATLGLDRELGPDDMTELVADLAAGGEGFIESGSY